MVPNLQTNNPTPHVYPNPDTYENFPYPTLY